LCLLESELFSFAAFLSTCLLPLDLPTMVIMVRKIIYKYIRSRPILSMRRLYTKKKKADLFNQRIFFDCEVNHSHSLLIQVMAGSQHGGAHGSFPLSRIDQPKRKGRSLSLF
jgi:hypothetical protein